MAKERKKFSKPEGVKSVHHYVSAGAKIPITPVEKSPTCFG
jgi:hypothetical protein